MEFTFTLQLLSSFAIIVLICTTVLLAFKKGWVFILGVVLICVLAKQCSTATIITCYSDGSTKIAEYLYKYRDTMGNEYEIENGGTYVFYDGLGETGIRSTCELTIFPIVYTSDRTKIGSAVYGEVTRISLEPYKLHRVSHAINYPFKSVPKKLDTDTFEKEEEIWSIQYTENLEDIHASFYHELIYRFPDTF